MAPIFAHKLRNFGSFETFGSKKSALSSAAFAISFAASTSFTDDESQHCSQRHFGEQHVTAKPERRYLDHSLRRSQRVGEFPHRRLRRRFLRIQRLRPLPGRARAFARSFILPSNASIIASLAFASPVRSRAESSVASNPRVIFSVVRRPLDQRRHRVAPVAIVRRRTFARRLPSSRGRRASPSRASSPASIVARIAFAFAIDRVASRRCDDVASSDDVDDDDDDARARASSRASTDACRNRLGGREGARVVARITARRDVSKCPPIDPRQREIFARGKGEIGCGHSVSERFCILVVATNEGLGRDPRE